MKYYSNTVIPKKRLVTKTQNNKQHLYNEMYSQVDSNLRNQLTFKLYVLKKLYDIVGKYRKIVYED